MATKKQLQAWWETYVHEPWTLNVYTIPDAREAYEELLALAEAEGVKVRAHNPAVKDITL